MGRNQELKDTQPDSLPARGRAAALRERVRTPRQGPAVDAGPWETAERSSVRPRPVVLALGTPGPVERRLLAVLRARGVVLVDGPPDSPAWVVLACDAAAFSAAAHRDDDTPIVSVLWRPKPGPCRVEHSDGVRVVDAHDPSDVADVVEALLGARTSGG